MIMMMAARQVILTAPMMTQLKEVMTLLLEVMTLLLEVMTLLCEVDKGNVKVTIVDHHHQCENDSQVDVSLDKLNISKTEYF